MGAATERIVCRPLGAGHHPNGVWARITTRKSLDRGTGRYPFRVSPETNPPQPEDVDRAIADVLAEDATSPDPWWQAGTQESLVE